MGVSGRIVVITGGSRGIGAAAARRFAAEGESIIINYQRSEEAASKLVEELTQAGGRAAHFRADVSNPSEVESLFSFCDTTFGAVDVLVNVASYSSRVSWNVPVTEIQWEEWQKTIDVDLKGTMLCSHAAFKRMSTKGAGKIINFSSSAALYGDVPTYLYTAAKAALVGITRTLGKAFAPQIQVNCIAPGSIATDWIETWKLTEADLQEIVRDTPMKRIGKAEEVAELVYFLASPKCSFITGQTIVIDGGILML